MHPVTITNALRHARGYQPRAIQNRLNSLYSTGPRTPEGKARSSQNALKHGLTSRLPVLPTEDPAAYQQHCKQFHDEHEPATATEFQLVQELADTAWRLNRIPLLEADLFERAANPPNETARMLFDIVDATKAIAKLGIHGNRLSRQFQKTLQLLTEIQGDRQLTERRDLVRAAGIMELCKHKGLPWNPADDGFDFSIEFVQKYAERLTRQNDARFAEYARFESGPVLLTPSTFAKPWDPPPTYSPLSRRNNPPEVVAKHLATSGTGLPAGR